MSNPARSRAFALACVAAALLAACSDDATPPPAPSGGKPAVYQLAATADTTITLTARKGQTIRIRTTGSVCTNPGGPVVDCDIWTDADGIPDCHYVEDAWQCHNLPFMALIGRRVDERHDYFLVGTDYTETCDEDAEIEIKINDWILSDNAGAFTISVSRP